MTATRFINIATEDRLTEAVAERLVACYTGFAVDLKMGLQGNGHLRKNLKSYFEIADRTPLLLMTDLDDTPCVVKKLENWKKSVNRSPPPHFAILHRRAGGGGVAAGRSQRVCRVVGAGSAAFAG